MANLMYLKIDQITFSAVLQENPTLEISSEFSSFNELVPEFGNLANVVVSGTSALSGKVGRGMLNLQNKLDVPRWTKTNPIRFNTSITFYTKNDAREDVWLPTNLILSTVVLSKDKASGNYVVPGVSLPNMSKIAKQTKDQVLTNNDVESAKNKSSAIDEQLTGGLAEKTISNWSSLSKFCSLWIPGVVYIPVALIRSVQPVYSKQLTKKGFPLWSKLEMSIEGLYPATDFNLTASENQTTVVLADQQSTPPLPTTTGG